jgi:DNA-directed RNA polymerase subunit K/omega
MKKTKESSQKPKESSQKTKESSHKTRESSQSKPSTETSFDMFGSNNIDYRETILNYDCSKNKTLPKMTKYEIALVIGKRAKQIEDGANANIKVMPGKNSIEIAEEELRQGVIPFYIKRPIGNSFELFKLADMEFYID